MQVRYKGGKMDEKTPEWMREHIEELAFVASYVQVKYPEIYAEAVEQRNFDIWLGRIQGKEQKHATS